MNNGRNFNNAQKNGNHGQNAKLPSIELNYKKVPELFGDIAKETAEAIENGVKANQMRNFYNYVLDLHKRAKDGEDFEEIQPFVKMLKSKVAYAKTRKNVNDKFVEMINRCVSQVNNANDLEVFKLFFESVLGFSKKS